MPEKIAGRPAARIMITIHRHFLPELLAALRELGLEAALLESGRSVRERRHRRAFGLPGMVVRLDNNPLEIVYCTVGQAIADESLRFLAARARLDIPGRGSAIRQEIVDHSPRTLLETLPPLPQATAPLLLSELCLLTIILSLPGDGEELSRIALNLGTGVPIVSLGAGTGIRDRLGLLRITIPPEKELVRLIVPAPDARGLATQIIEEGRLDRPGRGFLYATQVSRGILDTRLRIGPQQHPATMEQIIAAIDQLTTGAGWRRRFATGESVAVERRFQEDLREVTFLCPEGKTDLFLDFAMEAGARGATTSRVRRINLRNPADGDSAWERCIITAPAGKTDAIVAALLRADVRETEPILRLQVATVPYAFSHGSRGGEGAS